MNAGETKAFTRTLEAVECGQCGVLFGLTTLYIEERRSDHNTFYCPNGHPRAYRAGQSEADKLRAELATANDHKKWFARRYEETRQEAQTNARRAAAARGQVTRIKRRVANGVCPVCTRSFADLKRHMCGQHPDFADPAEAVHPEHPSE